MKLYYIPTPDKWDNITIIICIDGICVEETELFTRHPDAVLFDPAKPIHLNLPKETHP